MSSPFIWIFLPLFAAVGFWFIRRKNLCLFLAGFLSLFLGGLALFIPIEKDIVIGNTVFQISSFISIAGRKFVIEQHQENLLVLIFGCGSFWFFGGLVIDVRRELGAIGLGAIALMTAALAVEPLLYASLLLEACVLVSVPMLVHPYEKDKSGVIRFVTYLTPGMSFLLLAGWALAQDAASPANPEWLNICVILLCSGFGLYLSVFPFNTWVPVLFEQAHPYITGFWMALLPVVTLMIAIGFLEGFPWLRTHPLFLEIARLSGVLTVFTAGIWAAFEKNLSRILGYAVLLDIGFFLLAISLGRKEGWEIVLASAIPRFLGIALCSISLVVLQKYTKKLDFTEVKAAFWKMPFASGGYVAGMLSLAGLPLLASFPLRVRLLEELAKGGFSTVFLTLIGVASLFLGILRAIASLADIPGGKLSFNESWTQIALLTGGVLLLLGLGLLPGEIQAPLKNLLAAFPKLR